MAEKKRTATAPEEPVTMKEIAAELGVSINTVHKAITGKPGVSDERRAQIQATAKAMGYHRNEVASSLRRKDVRVAVCLPSAEGEGASHNEALWEGVRRFAKTPRAAGVSFEELPYEPGEYGELLATVEKRVSVGHDLAGLLAFAPPAGAEREALGRIAETGLPVELVDNDCASIARLGASISDYRAAGQLMAEQALNLVAGRGADGEPIRVLLLAGDTHTDSNYLMARTFRNGMKAADTAIELEEIAGGQPRVATVRRELAAKLATSDAPTLICCVGAAATQVAAETLPGAATRPLAIGCGVFPESAEALRGGTFTNLIYQDRCTMVERAAETLAERVLWGTRPKRPVQSVGVDLVFKSNLNQYLA